MIESLRQWSKNNNDRSKLQHAYFVCALAVLVLAGLASLVNAQLGQNLLLVSTGFAVLFFANAVAWALLDSFVITKISRIRSTKK